MKKKKRYFIVCYVGTNNSNEPINGQVNIDTDGCYVKTSSLKKYMKENNKPNVVITNIIELSKKDFEAWNS